MPQGTVKSFDPASRTAVVLDNDLQEWPVDREAVDASGLLELRLGQRVRYELDGDRVSNINIVSF